MKNFSYKQITIAAEQKIILFMQQAQKATEPGLITIYRDWAIAVWIFWDSLTVGWQEEDDYVRLKKLTKVE